MKQFDWFNQTITMEILRNSYTMPTRALSGIHEAIFNNLEDVS